MYQFVRSALQQAPLCNGILHIDVFSWLCMGRIVTLENNVIFINRKLVEDVERIRYVFTYYLLFVMHVCLNMFF